MVETWRRLIITLQRNKFLYYVHNFLRQLPPPSWNQARLHGKLNNLTSYNRQEIKNRVDYYNKLDTLTDVGINAKALSSIDMMRPPKAYNFDIFKMTRFFHGQLKANFLLGDIRHTADVPSMQKSRPISDSNQNAILLKLDRKRHFVFVKDPFPFSRKKDLLIGRGNYFQHLEHRFRFMEMYFGHPMCDLGQVNLHDGNEAWIKPKIHIIDHLKYKFILSLEGYDVATNLKWIMSSNSIAVMPKPKVETWFMEGTLIADHHYIEIRDDYADLEERLLYFIANEDKCLQIIQNANRYVTEFLDPQKEELISLLVMQKYLYHTGQTDEYVLADEVKSSKTLQPVPIQQPVP